MLEAAAYRVIQRGPIDDVTPLGGDGRAVGPAYCRCPHGAEWGFEGGGSCPLCVPLAGSRDDATIYVVAVPSG